MGPTAQMYVTHLAWVSHFQTSFCMGGSWTGHALEREGRMWRHLVRWFLLFIISVAGPIVWSNHRFGPIKGPYMPGQPWRCGPMRDGPRLAHHPLVWSAAGVSRGEKSSGGCGTHWPIWSQIWSRHLAVLDWATYACEVVHELLISGGPLS